MKTPITIGTFNAENLFLRYKFFYSAKPKKGETQEQADKRYQQKMQEFLQKGAYPEQIETTLEDKKEIKAGQTSNTAKVILAHKPQIMVLQEIENMVALKEFNTTYLKRLYDHKILIAGNDPRGINVGLLSNFPVTYLKTNVDVSDPVTGKQLFSRDCLEVGICTDKEAEKTTLTLYINHLKSQLATSKQDEIDSTEKRGRQAKWVAELLLKKYGSALKGKFVVCGDFNQHFASPELQQLLQLPGLENVVQQRPLKNLKIPGQPTVEEKDRWTYYYDGAVQQLDYILLSPDLAKSSARENVEIEKRGFANYVDQYGGERFESVGKEGTEASDHAAVFTTLRI